MVTIAALASGCSAYSMWYGSDKPAISYVLLKAKIDKSTGKQKVQVTSDPEDINEDDKHLGTIMSWSPEFNAAFVTSLGKGCIQPATYAETGSTNITIPAEALSLDGEGESIGVAYTKAIEKLATVTDQSTFLSIGMYGICQLQANDSINNLEVKELVTTLLNKAAEIKTGNKAPIEETKPATKDTIDVSKKDEVALTQ